MTIKVGFGDQANVEAVKNLCIDRRRIIYYISKRILDIAIASVLFLVCLPLMLLISCLIFIYSPGHILFVQKRVGAKLCRDGDRIYWEQVEFPCYKFRTMKENADPEIHKKYVQALIKNDVDTAAKIQGGETDTKKLIQDTRIIRPGKYLRKFSLDELPQLWNVIVGDMSLVGPRPAIPYEVDVYLPWHKKRLQAKPGLTGLQQVTARCTKSFDHQVNLDLQYIERQSLYLDIKILLKTPFAVISTKGAL